MLTELEKRIDEHSEKFNRKLNRNYRKEPVRMRNTITEVKNILEGINSRLGDKEECISGLKDRIIEITQSEKQKQKQI